MINLETEQQKDFETCPIKDCNDPVDPNMRIEFTIPNVEGVFKTSVCRQCHYLIARGVVSGFSLAPTFVPALEVK